MLRQLASLRGGASDAAQPAVRELVSLRNWAPAAGAVAAAAGQRRGMWGEPPSREEVMHRDSFYDNVRGAWMPWLGWLHGCGVLLGCALLRCLCPAAGHAGPPSHAGCWRTIAESSPLACS